MSNSKILSFEEFVNMGDSGAEMQPAGIEAPATDLETPTDGSELPVPAEEPTMDGPEHNVPVHMTDDESGEAEAEAPVVDANVSVEEPKND